MFFGLVCCPVVFLVFPTVCMDINMKHTVAFQNEITLLKHMLGDRCTSVMVESGFLVETLCCYVKMSYTDKRTSVTSSRTRSDLNKCLKQRGKTII